MVDLSLYSVAHAATICGVLAGADLTFESAYAKLCYLFGKGYS